MHPDDLPPLLLWESSIWWLYLRVQTQWRINHLGVKTGLDYGPAVAIIRALRWDLPFALEMLQLIEVAYLCPEESPND